MGQNPRKLLKPSPTFPIMQTITRFLIKCPRFQNSTHPVSSANFFKGLQDSSLDLPYCAVVGLYILFSHKAFMAFFTLKQFMSTQGRCRIRCHSAKKPVGSHLMKYNERVGEIRFASHLKSNLNFFFIFKKIIFSFQSQFGSVQDNKTTWVCLAKGVGVVVATSKSQHSNAGRAKPSQKKSNRDSSETDTTP